MVQIPLQDAKTVTLATDTANSGVKVLYIDPVVVRK